MPRCRVHGGRCDGASTAAAGVPSRATDIVSAAAGVPSPRGRRGDRLDRRDLHFKNENRSLVIKEMRETVEAVVSSWTREVERLRTALAYAVCLKEKLAPAETAAWVALLGAASVFASRTLASRTLASRTLASRTLASRTLASFGSQVFGSRVFGSRVFGSRVFGSRVFGSRTPGWPSMGGEVLRRPPRLACLARATGSVSAAGGVLSPRGRRGDRFDRLEL